MKPAAAELRSLARRDPALGRFMKRVPRFPGFPDRSNPRQRSHFVSLASAIVHQQLSTRAAETIFGRLCELTPGKSFPKPPEVLELPRRRLRGAGLSRAKVESMLDLAGRVAEGSLPLARIARLKDERVIEKLVEVRGIGVWSAQMFLMFSLGRLDVMPAADLGIQKGFQRLEGLDELPSPAAILERSEAWSPLCSVAAWTLWRVTELEA
jgi:DNA-3-methyladenine glycosylase II